MNDFEVNKTADKVIKKRYYNYDCNRGSYIYCPEFICTFCVRVEKVFLTALLGLRTEMAQ